MSALQIPVRSGDHIIAILSLSAPERSMAYLQKMRSELTEILPEAISDVYQDHLYFLIGGKN